MDWNECTLHQGKLNRWLQSRDGGRRKKEEEGKRQSGNHVEILTELFDLELLGEGGA